jgi:nucleotide-binding universal stress UspA family protein
MSTHGRGGLGRLVFGSVAQAVLRQAEVPVFLMRATESQVTGRAAREAVK